MRLAPDEAHKTPTALTEEGRPAFRVFDFDVFHNVKATAHAKSVNSVSLQPILASMPFLEPFGNFTVSSALATLYKNE